MEAASAASCCMTCFNTDGCDYWTYVKNSTACYLKHQDDRTIYIDAVDPSRISSLASPHAYNFDNHKNNLWNETVHGINFKPNLRGKRRLSTGSEDSLNPLTAAPSHYKMGIDFMGTDWVKFSNRREETNDPYVNE